jgi:hypothetical protein
MHVDAPDAPAASIAAADEIEREDILAAFGPPKIFLIQLG